MCLVLRCQPGLREGRRGAVAMALMFAQLGGEYMSL